MPRWALSSMTWAEEDVYIIGGGPSLLNFRWDLLTARRTIGCNKAYRLGPDVVKIVCFGDLKFFSDFKDDLMAFAGPVVTSCPALLHRNEPWLWTVPRMTRGLGTNALGWNGSTGAMAINLALALGGKRVFLLGFDMGLVDGRSHWHGCGLISGQGRLHSIACKMLSLNGLAIGDRQKSSSWAGGVSGARLLFPQKTRMRSNCRSVI